MTYNDLTVLIPSHSLEDFPTELGETDAASLLNAFAVLWHPVLLAQAEAIPAWHRSDEPPETLENRLVIVPTTCEEWLPGGWADYARGKGAIVVSGMSDRREMLEAALAPLENRPEVDPDLVADFFALGTSYLQIELLTRHMHYYSSLDEVHLQRESVAAAKAALAGDATAVRTHLQSCFDLLTENRERFYPVDCYLIDLCLLIPRLADEHLKKTLAARTPLNLLIPAVDLDELARDKPQMIELIREAWQAGAVDLIGGEFRERPSPLLPVESVLWDFRQGQAVFHKHFGRTPKTWGRRRYGLSTMMPQILNKFGYRAGLHVVLDDGLYPDAEQSKIRWEGCDGTIIDAMTRIPLPADSASSYLRFPLRMAESMEQDHVAAVVFARWPEVQTPWFEDFRRTHKFSPVLGRLVALDDFFEHTDDPGRMSTYDQAEYFSPFLIQAVARQEENPISRYTGHLTRRHRFDTGCWCRSVAAVLSGQPVPDEELAARERVVEDAGPEGTADAVDAAEAMLAEFVPESAARLSQIVLHGAGERAGALVFNPLAFPRIASVELPDFDAPPAVAGPVKGAQFDERRKTAVVELPACGFAWIPAAAREGEAPAEPLSPGPGKASKGAPPPLAEQGVLRNEFFEVYLNEETGGIAQIKEYGRRPNRLSQQLAFRFPRERSVTRGEGDDPEQTRTFYSEMRCRTSEVTSSGPLVGEIVTAGDIIDQADDTRLAGYRQTVRLWRARRIVELDIELDVEHLPDGDPWTNYYASRFAWNDPAATLTRSLQQGAHAFQGERFESPHYFEIASDEERTTILNMGQTFHRKTGMRMLDTLLVAAGETERRFRFVIAVDADYPMQAALDAIVPPVVVPTRSGPPRTGNSGWFFHLNAKNVQILRIMGLMNEPPEQNDSWAAESSPPLQGAEGGTAKSGVDRTPPGPPGGGPEGFAVRLMETEGRNRQLRLRCFRTPKRARQRDFQGRTIGELKIDGDAVRVDVTAYEIADVEVRFDNDE